MCNKNKIATHNVSILSSKRLTKSFTRNQNHNIWESISLSKEEAKSIITSALKRMNKNSEPLTITITVNT